MYLQIMQPTKSMVARLSKQLVNAATIEFRTEQQARAAVETAANKIYNDLLKQIDEEFKIKSAKSIN